MHARDAAPVIGMDETDTEARRPHAVMIFGLLAVLGFVLTLVLGGGHPERVPGPQQPDAAVAVADELSDLPGVKAVEVSNAVECLDDCTKTSHKYLATVNLRPDVTPSQISTIVSVHDEIAPQAVGVADVPITLMLGADKTLRVAPVHYGFGVTQAEAYLNAVQASAEVQVGYGPPAADESPLLTVAATLPGLVCGYADVAMAQTVPAVSAAASAGGIQFGTVRLDCGSVTLEAGIAAGAGYQPGWTQAATSIQRVCLDGGCGEATGVLHDVAVLFEDGSTNVVVELNSGQQLSSDVLASLQGAVDALSAAGAADPQLDLKSF